MFPCHGCGDCCRKLDAALAGVTDLPEGNAWRLAGAAFPYAPRPDGSCPQLGADNRCGVYATRPVFCDVDRLFDALALPDVSRALWYELNAAGCPPPS